MQTPDGATTALKLYKVLASLRDLHQDITAQQAMVYFHVAARPGCTQRDLYRALEVSDSAASRNLALLSDIGNRGIPGMDLIAMKVNPLDRRERHLYLTPKGKRLLDTITNDMAR